MHKNYAAPVAPPPLARRSTRGSRRVHLRGPDKSHAEGPEEPGHHQAPPSTPKPKGLNPMMPDIKFFHAMRNALQVQATLAARQGEKSAEVPQLEEEIAKLRSNLANSVSRQVESGGSLETLTVWTPKLFL